MKVKVCVPVDECMCTGPVLVHIRGTLATIGSRDAVIDVITDAMTDAMAVDPAPEESDGGMPSLPWNGTVDGEYVQFWRVWPPTAEDPGIKVTQRKRPEDKRTETRDDTPPPRVPTVSDCERVLDAQRQAYCELNFFDPCDDVGLDEAIRLIPVFTLLPGGEGQGGFVQMMIGIADAAKHFNEDLTYLEDLMAQYNWPTTDPKVTPFAFNSINAALDRWKKAHSKQGRRAPDLNDAVPGDPKTFNRHHPVTLKKVENALKRPPWEGLQDPNDGRSFFQTWMMDATHKTLLSRDGVLYAFSDLVDVRRRFANVREEMLKKYMQTYFTVPDDAEARKALHMEASRVVPPFDPDWGYLMPWKSHAPATSGEKDVVDEQMWKAYMEGPMGSKGYDQAMAKQKDYFSVNHNSAGFSVSMLWGEDVVLKPPPKTKPSKTSRDATAAPSCGVGPVRPRKPKTLEEEFPDLPAELIQVERARRQYNNSRGAKAGALKKHLEDYKRRFAGENPGTQPNEQAIATERVRWYAANDNHYREKAVKAKAELEAAKKGYAEWIAGRPEEEQQKLMDDWTWYITVNKAEGKVSEMQERVKARSTESKPGTGEDKKAKVLTKAMERKQANLAEADKKSVRWLQWWARDDAELIYLAEEYEEYPDRRNRLVDERIDTAKALMRSYNEKGDEMRRDRVQKRIERMDEARMWDESTIKVRQKTEYNEYILEYLDASNKTEEYLSHDFLLRMEHEAKERDDADVIRDQEVWHKKLYALINAKLPFEESDREKRETLYAEITDAYPKAAPLQQKTGWLKTTKKLLCKTFYAEYQSHIERHGTLEYRERYEKEIKDKRRAMVASLSHSPDALAKYMSEQIEGERKRFASTVKTIQSNAEDEYNKAVDPQSDAYDEGLAARSAEDRLAWAMQRLENMYVELGESDPYTVMMAAEKNHNQFEAAAAQGNAGAETATDAAWRKSLSMFTEEKKKRSRSALNWETWSENFRGHMAMRWKQEQEAADLKKRYNYLMALETKNAETLKGKDAADLSDAEKKRLKLESEELQVERLKTEQERQRLLRTDPAVFMRDLRKAADEYLAAVHSLERAQLALQKVASYVSAKNRTPGGDDREQREKELNVTLMARMELEEDKSGDDSVRRMHWYGEDLALAIYADERVKVQSLLPTKAGASDDAASPTARYEAIKKKAAQMEKDKEESARTKEAKKAQTALQASRSRQTFANDTLQKKEDKAHEKQGGFLLSIGADDEDDFGVDMLLAPSAAEEEYARMHLEEYFEKFKPRRVSVQKFRRTVTYQYTSDLYRQNEEIAEENEGLPRGVARAPLKEYSDQGLMNYLFEWYGQGVVHRKFRPMDLSDWKGEGQAELQAKRTVVTETVKRDADGNLLYHTADGTETTEIDKSKSGQSLWVEAVLIKEGRHCISTLQLGEEWTYPPGADAPSAEKLGARNLPNMPPEWVKSGIFVWSMFPNTLQAQMPDQGDEDYASKFAVWKEVRRAVFDDERGNNMVWYNEWLGSNAENEEAQNKVDEWLENGHLVLQTHVDRPGEQTINGPSRMVEDDNRYAAEEKGKAAIARKQATRYLSYLLKEKDGLELTEDEAKIVAHPGTLLPEDYAVMETLDDQVVAEPDGAEPGVEEEGGEEEEDGEEEDGEEEDGEEADGEEEDDKSSESESEEEEDEEDGTPRGPEGEGMRSGLMDEFTQPPDRSDDESDEEMDDADQKQTARGTTRPRDDGDGNDDGGGQPQGKEQRIKASQNKQVFARLLPSRASMRGVPLRAQTTPSTTGRRDVRA